MDINFGSNVKEMKDINLNDYGIVQLDRKVKILKEYISGTISKILNDERV